jgi:tetratricopeptide (TPR) repeat protein
VTVSYAVDRALWGFSSFGFHLTNFILHIIAVGLFYGVCTRALSDAGSRLRPKGASARSGQGQGRARAGADPGLTPEWPAFFAAAGFALHPLMASAVGYISARGELLGALGILACLTYARRAIVASNTIAGVMASLFGLVALTSSVSALGLPLLILAYDAWVLRDRGWRQRAIRVYLPAFAAIAVAAVWYLPALLAVERVPPRGLTANALTEVFVLWRYAGLLVVPYGHALVHQVRWVTTPFDPVGLLALALLAAAVAGAIRIRQSQPLVAFGVVWFLAMLAPTSSLIPLPDAMAEHRVYIAGAGLFLAVASALASPLATRRLARAVATGVLVLLTVQTYRRIVLWSDPMKLWQRSVERAPEAWQARLGYADLLREVGRCDQARAEYEAVLRLYPNHGGAKAGLDACRDGS